MDARDIVAFLCTNATITRIDANFVSLSVRCLK